VRAQQAAAPATAPAKKPCGTKKARAEASRTTQRQEPALRANVHCVTEGDRGSEGQREREKLAD